MGSFSNHSTPVGVKPKPANSAKEREVAFAPSPVTGISRPVNNAEHWALYEFECHALGCKRCHNPYRVHKLGKRLCDQGHQLAHKVALDLYQAKDSQIYSREREGHNDVRVELPAGFGQALSLLKAIERSVRHNERFVSMDRTYYVPPRLPERRHMIRVDQPSRHLHPAPSPEIVDWPHVERRATVAAEPKHDSLHGAASKRGSLYMADMAELQKREQLERRVAYKLEVREPSKPVGHPHRNSGFWG